MVNSSAFALIIMNQALELKWNVPPTFLSLLPVPPQHLRHYNIVIMYNFYITPRALEYGQSPDKIRPN